MICEKCGANIPSDRNMCINCGAPVEKPDWVEEIEKKSEIKIEDYSFKGKNRMGYYGIASGTVVAGLVIALTIFLRIPYLPGLILASIMILVIAPLAGMLLVTVGHYRTGCVFTCIGAFTFFPIGLAGRKYLLNVWNFGIETSYKIKSGEKEFVKDGAILKPPLPLTIGVIAVVILIIVLPVISYMFIMNKPMIEITSYHVPSQYQTNSRVDVKVTLYNYGHQEAEAEKIQVEIEGSSAGRLSWEGPEIGMMKSETESFEVSPKGRLKNIIVYYDGEKVAEQEIEGLWIPTFG